MDSTRGCVRDARGQPKDYKTTASIKSLIRFLGECEAAANSVDITIEHDLIRRGLYVIKTKNGPKLVNVRLRSPVAIFNGTVTRGGRYYRTIWTSLPKKYRRALRINGSPISEHDFSACQVRLAYFGLGALDALNAFGTEDLSCATGTSVLLRAVHKRATQILTRTTELAVPIFNAR